MGPFSEYTDRFRSSLNVAEKCNGTDDDQIGRTVSTNEATGEYKKPDSRYDHGKHHS